MLEKEKSKFPNLSWLKGLIKAGAFEEFQQELAKVPEPIRNYFITRNPDTWASTLLEEIMPNISEAKKDQLNAKYLQPKQVEAINQTDNINEKNLLLEVTFINNQNQLVDFLLDAIETLPEDKRKKVMEGNNCPSELINPLKTRDEKKAALNIFLSGRKAPESLLMEALVNGRRDIYEYLVSEGARSEELIFDNTFRTHFDGQHIPFKGNEDAFTSDPAKLQEYKLKYKSQFQDSFEILDELSTKWKTTQKNDNRLINIAAFFGHTQLVSSLLNESGIDPNLLCSRNRPLITHVSANPALRGEILNLLLDNKNVNLEGTGMGMYQYFLSNFKEFKEFIGKANGRISKEEFAALEKLMLQFNKDKVKLLLENQLLDLDLFRNNWEIFKATYGFFEPEKKYDCYKLLTEYFEAQDIKLKVQAFAFLTASNPFAINLSQDWAETPEDSYSAIKKLQQIFDKKYVDIKLFTNNFELFNELLTSLTKEERKELFQSKELLKLLVEYKDLLQGFREEIMEQAALLHLYQPNYQRLKANQEQTKANLEDYLAKPKLPVSKPLELYMEVRSILDDLQALRGTQEERRKAYSAIIDNLEEARDNEFGVVWHKGKLHADKSCDLIRDARNAQQIMESPVSFALQAISSIRAIEKIIEREITNSEIKAQAIQQLAKRLEQVGDLLPQEDGEVFKGIDIKNFNFELVKILDNAGVKDGISKIAFAKEMLSFDDPQYHVTTISHIPDRSELLIESDAMLLGLTKSQQAQYRAIANTQLGQEVQCEAIDMGWYNQLPEFEKALIQEYAHNIAQGNYILPNQLTNQLIGLRNAYSKATYMYNINKKLELLNEGLHSAAPTFHGKGNKQAIVNDNIEQANSFLPVGHDLDINTLNSPGNPTGIDREICKQILESQKSAGGYRSLTPLAKWRILPGNANNNSGYEYALKQIAEGLKKDGRQNFQKLVDYLQNGQSEKAAKQEIQGLSDKKLAKILEHIYEAKNLILNSNKRKLWRGNTDPENGNLSLSSRMRIIAFEVNKGDLSNYFKVNNIEVKVPEILTHCKSGKDRTGLAFLETSRMALLDRLGIADYNSASATRIFKPQVNGGHTQFITSVNGGTTGTHGIKKDSRSAIPNGVYNRMDGIILETASFNKFKVKLNKANKLKPIPSSSNVQIKNDHIDVATLNTFAKPLEVTVRPSVGYKNNPVTNNYPNNQQAQFPQQYMQQSSYPLAPASQYPSQVFSQAYVPGFGYISHSIPSKSNESSLIMLFVLIMIAAVTGGGLLGICLTGFMVAAAITIDSNTSKALPLQSYSPTQTSLDAYQKVPEQTLAVAPKAMKPESASSHHRHRIEQERLQQSVRQP